MGGGVGVGVGVSVAQAFVMLISCPDVRVVLNVAPDPDDWGRTKPSHGTEKATCPTTVTSVKVSGVLLASPCVTGLPSGCTAMTRCVTSLPSPMNEMTMPGWSTAGGGVTTSSDPTGRVGSMEPLATVTTWYQRLPTTP